MLVIKEKCGNLNTASVHGRDIDFFSIEWYEAKKRILHKQTKKGKEVTLRFLNENPDLKEGDILWQDEKSIIAVEIHACKCIIVHPADMLAASSIAYETGNRHLPLFYEEGELLVPFDIPFYNLLLASGYKITAGDRKLNNPLRTSVLPHLQVAASVSNSFQLTTISS